MSDKERCRFLDTDEQHVVFTPTDKTVVEHEDWYIDVPKEVIEKFSKFSPLLSPWSYLYTEYKKHQQPKNALFVLATSNYIYFVTFQESKPYFYEIQKSQKEVPLANVIEAFLKDFYEREGSYFIEKIYVYKSDNVVLIIEEDLEERLLIPVQIERVEEASLCNVPYLVSLQVKKQKSLLSTGILFAAFTFFLVFVGYDGYVRYKIHSLQKNIQHVIDSQVALANENNHLQSQLMKIKKIAPYVSKSKQHNAFVVSTIKNVFDLIPSQAYLTYAEFQKRYVVLKGFSQSKKILVQSLYEKLSHAFAKKRLIIKKRKNGYEFEVVYEKSL